MTSDTKSLKFGGERKKKNLNSSTVKKKKKKSLENKEQQLITTLNPVVSTKQMILQKTRNKGKPLRDLFFFFFC